MINPPISRRACLACACASVAGFASAAHAAAPATVEDKVRGELVLAKAEGRTLAIFFWATWCPYCRLFNMVLNDPEAGPVFNRYFRLLRINVRERSADQKAQQLPGAEAMLKRYQNNEHGIPLFVFLRADGALASSSVSEKTKSNIGFPVEPSELDWFEAMLAKASPKISVKDTALLRAACVRIYNQKS